jgi:hypothetical protein
MDIAPDSRETGGGAEPGISPPILPDYEEEVESGMEGVSSEGREAALVYEEEYCMEVEPEPDEEHLPKRADSNHKGRSYSIKSSQSDSSVSEKAKKFIAENRPGSSKIQNIQTVRVDLEKKTVAAIPPPPPALGKPDCGSNISHTEGGGGISASCPNERDSIDFPPQFYMIRAARNRSANVA